MQEAVSTINNPPLLSSRLFTLHLMRLERVGATFFQASTSEVYGDPAEHPQSESYRGNVNPVGPRAWQHKRQQRILDTDGEERLDALKNIMPIAHLLLPLNVSIAEIIYYGAVLNSDLKHR